jgi:YjbE family integral membrane protein
MLDVDALNALAQVILVDLVLAGDNAIVVGLAAAGLPHALRNRVILIGIVAAAVLRILFALVTVQLLQIIGLLLAGGILLLWVCWKFYRELRMQGALGDEEAEPPPEKTVRQAIIQIIIADVSTC